MAQSKFPAAIAPLVREEQKKRDMEIRSSQAWRDRQPLATTKVTEVKFSWNITYKGILDFPIKVIAHEDVNGYDFEVFDEKTGAKIEDCWPLDKREHEGLYEKANTMFIEAEQERRERLAAAWEDHQESLRERRRQ